MSNVVYNIDIYKDINYLSKIWNDFQTKSTFTIFQSYEWVAQWIQSFNQENNFKSRIVHVTDDSNRTLMIIPFVIEKRFGINILNLYGGDYYGILFSDYGKSKFESIWNAALKKIDKYDLIYISNIPEKIGNRSNPLVKFLNVKTIPYGSHQAIIDNDWMRYYSSIKKKITKDTERQIKRLKQLGSMSFIVANTNSKSEKIINEMIKQKSKKYENTGIKNHLKSKSFKDFYKYSFQHKSEFINSHISSIEINGEIIATHWGIIDHRNRIFYYLMPAHKEGEWLKYSPGRILMVSLMQWCSDNNFSIFDFTGGNENYKTSWANNRFKLYYYLYPVTILGYFIFLLISIHKKLKKS